MSITAIILMNITVAATLVAILAAVMLAPSRLRRHFEEGHTHRQKAALREQRRAEAAQPRRTYPDSLASVFRSVPIQVGRKG